MTTIRHYSKSDLPALLQLNNAAAPAVNILSLDQLEAQCANSYCALVAEHNQQPSGLLMCFLEGHDYSSNNYLWLSERLPKFAYVDRVFVDTQLRGQNIGEKLYAALADLPEVAKRPITCEVNTRPANPGSLRFHKRLGFYEIGTADDGDKAVVYLKRDPAEHGQK
ncbi:MAG: GNAT family N-acetyltransferase [Rhodobacteraceae bacterium]|nr:GNAT family N-acetyltransferase [Paracoccaceae bacterium]